MLKQNRKAFHYENIILLRCYKSNKQIVFTKSVLQHDIPNSSFSHTLRLQNKMNAALTSHMIVFDILIKRLKKDQKPLHTFYMSIVLDPIPNNPISNNPISNILEKLGLCRNKFLVPFHSQC